MKRNEEEDAGEKRERDKRNIKIDKASVTGNTKRTKFKEKVRRMKKRNCT